MIWNKIYNPLTNKKESINSKVGKETLLKYIHYGIGCGKKNTIKRKVQKKTPANKCDNLKRYKQPKCTDVKICKWIPSKGCFPYDTVATVLKPSEKSPKPGKKPTKRVLKIKPRKKQRITSKISKTDTPNKLNIVKNLKIMINNVYAKKDPAAPFKTRSYSKAIKALSEFDGEITSPELAQQILLDFGFKNPKKIIVKISEILNTGSLDEADMALVNPIVIAVGNLTKVYDIGYKKAIELYDKHSITTLEQLKKAQKKAELEEEPMRILHNKQQLGLKYHDDLQLRIPRAEMIAYEKYLLAIASELETDPGAPPSQKIDIELSINGSYRRNLPSSGDIDVLVTGSDAAMARKKLIKVLKQNRFIIADLANGKKKYMGISKLPGYSTNRHIDIIHSERECYAFSVLYFTGSGGFNTKMRGIANKQGYSLNEYRMSHKATKKPVTLLEIQDKIGKDTFETEEDIFDFLGMDYIEPADRLNITPGKNL